MLSPAGTFLKPQLPRSRTQRLPRAPCPRMSSLDGTVTWGEAPRVPSTQERGRAGRHRPGSVSSVQPAGTDVSCVPGCTEQAWPRELVASRDLSASLVLSTTLFVSGLWLLSPCLVDGQPRLGPRGL